MHSISFTTEMIRAILAGRKTQTRRVMNPQIDTSHWKKEALSKPKEWRKMIQLGPVHHGYDENTWCLFNISDKASAVPYTSRKCPYVIGGYLWVRETWQAVHFDTDPETGYADNWYGAEKIPKDPDENFKRQYPVVYKADGDWEDDPYERGFKWRPSRYMPRWASRITLEILNVRVERVQDITEEGARAEGIIDGGCLNCGNNEPCGCDNPQPDSRDSFIYLWDSINKKHGWDTNPWVWVIEFKRIRP